MQRILKSPRMPGRPSAPAAGGREQRPESLLGPLALAGNHAVARALQRIAGPRRLQRYTITHADAGESIWGAIKHFDPDDWDEINTNTLAGAKLEELLTVLDGLASTNAGAAEMARKIRAEQQAQQDRPPMSSKTFSLPKLSEPMLVAAPKVAARPPSEMGDIWEHVYSKQPRSYAGRPDAVREQVVNAPAVRQLYRPPAAVLDAIGWNRLADWAENRSPGVEVRLEFVGADELRIELSFPPAGARDTTIVYGQNERFDFVVRQQHGVMRDQPIGIMKDLWEQEYAKAARNYSGEPGAVRERLLADPAVKVLFKTADPTFLNIIGWPVLSMPYEATGATTVTVELAFLGLGMFTVHTSFPWGMQDTTLSYAQKAGDIVISEVYRHRSTKTVPVEQPGVPTPKDLKPHLFVDMIKHQATGVADLGPDVAYISKAIKSPEGWGYNVWPKMGFDAAVPARHLEAMRADETAALSLGVRWLVARNDGTLRFSDLFTVEDPTVYRQLGDLWRKHGDTVEVSFDARGGSMSWKTLEHYKKMRS
jgi:hypothetical protein